MAVIQWFGGKIYNDLCNYVPVEVRDEITCFEENFLFKKGIKSFMRCKEDKVPAKKKKSSYISRRGRISDDWKLSFIKF